MRDEEYRAMFDLEEHLWWYDGMRAVTAAVIDGAPIDDSGLRLLDIGCGTGFSLLWLKERFKTEAAFGVDVSPLASAYWRQREIETAVVASAHRLPFGPGEFDLVTCFDVIYQLTDKEARAAVAEIQRVLRPGGWLFIREPAYEWMRGSHDVAVGTRHRYTKAELLRMLKSNGLVPRRSTYANFLLLWAALPHRILSRFRGGTDSDVRPVPGLVNKALKTTLKLEARLLRHLTLPAGLSVIALAEKRRS